MKMDFEPNLPAPRGDKTVVIPDERAGGPLTALAGTKAMVRIGETGDMIALGPGGSAPSPAIVSTEMERLIMVNGAPMEPEIPIGMVVVNTGGMGTVIGYPGIPSERTGARPRITSVDTGHPIVVVEEDSDAPDLGEGAHTGHVATRGVTVMTDSLSTQRGEGGDFLRIEGVDTRAPVMVAVADLRTPVMVAAADTRAPVMVAVADTRAPVMVAVADMRAPVMVAVADMRVPIGTIGGDMEMGNQE